MTLGGNWQVYDDGALEVMQAAEKVRGTLEHIEELRIAQPQDLTSSHTAYIMLAELEYRAELMLHAIDMCLRNITKPLSRSSSEWKGM